MNKKDIPIKPSEIFKTLDKMFEPKKTVLSVRDFAILYNVLQNEIRNIEHSIIFSTNDKTRKKLQENSYYQDLLRIREKLGGLNIEKELPSAEVENG